MCYVIALIFNEQRIKKKKKSMVELGRLYKAIHSTEVPQQTCCFIHYDQIQDFLNSD